MRADAPRDFSTSKRLATAAMLCVSGWLPAAQQVIRWSNNSTNYYTVFGAAPVTNIVAVAWEAAGAVGLRSDGAVLESYYGQRAQPSVTNAVALASSTWDPDYLFSLALRSDGHVVGWGWGIGGAIYPTNWSNIVAISEGISHAIGLKADGTVVSWGYDNCGVTDVPRGLSNVVAISAGELCSIALRGDGTVVAWGCFGYNPAPPATAPSWLSNVVAIAAGYDHALALRMDGTIVGWNGTYGGISPPYSNFLASISNVATISMGRESAVLKADGSILAWAGGGTTWTPQMQAVPAIATNVIALTSGDETVAVLGDGLPRTTAYLMSLTVAQGLPLVLPAAPSGTRVLDSKWSFDGVLLPGFTNAVLFLLTVDFTNAGVYCAVISNWYGVVTNTFTIGVAPFLITTPPQSQTVYGGAAVTFSEAVLGVNLTYQWQFSGTNLAAATGSSLTLTNVAPEQAGAYSVIVSNAFDMQTNTAALIVAGALRIVAQPADQTVLAGTTGGFQVAAEGVAPIYFQWQFNGASIAGATGSTLTLTNVGLGQTGLYAVVVSNAYSALQSSNANLNLRTLEITGPPQDVSAYWGATAAFSVTAAGIGPFSYQWQLNGTNLPGATNATLQLTNVQLSQAGVCSVTVSNAFTNLSTQAMLLVSQIANWNYPFPEMQTPPGLADLIAVATGGYHNVALRSDRTLVVWGHDTGHGELSILPEATNVIAIAAGPSKTMVLRADGTILSWGDNTYGENVVPASASSVVAIASDDHQSLALRSDGAVVGWGVTNAPPEATNVVAIAAGYVHALALRADGTVIAWGGDNYGQADVPAGLTGVVAIAAGGYDSLALRGDGWIINWGKSQGTMSAAPDGTATAAIGAGYGISYALKADGSVRALGATTGMPQALRNVNAIAVAYGHALALMGDQPPLMRASWSGISAGASGFLAFIPSQCGRVFRMESVGSLSERDWTALPLAPGNGATLTLTDPAPAAQPQRLYRVRRW